MSKQHLDYQRMTKWLNSAIQKEQHVRMIADNSIAIHGMNATTSLYGHNVYVLGTTMKESVSVLELLANAGLVVYVESDVNHEWRRFMRASNVPLVYLTVSDLESSAWIGETLRLTLAGRTKGSIRLILNELVSSYMSMITTSRVYRSTATYLSKQLVSTHAEWRKTWYTSPRFPRRSRIAKWCLPSKQRKIKA